MGFEIVPISFIYFRFIRMKTYASGQLEKSLYCSLSFLPDLKV